MNKIDTAFAGSKMKTLKSLPRITPENMAKAARMLIAHL